MKTTLTGIPGIGPETAKVLIQHGFKTLTAVAAASIEQLGTVPGFGTTRASRAIKAANELMSHSADDGADTAASQRPAPKKAAPATTGSPDKPTVKQRQAAAEKAKKQKDKIRKAKKDKKEKLKKEVAKKAKAKKEKQKKEAAKKAKQKKAAAKKVKETKAKKKKAAEKKGKKKKK